MRCEDGCSTKAISKEFMITHCLLLDHFNLNQLSFMASNSPWHNLYNTKRWYRLRYHQLQKQPLCEFHLKRNQVVSASIVDHVTPHKGDDTLFHDPDNLQSLCKRCHDSVKQRMEKGGTVTEFDDEGRVIW